MNTKQAKVLFKQLFTAFPQYEQWLGEITQKQLDDGRNPDDTTFHVWCRMMEPVSYECASIAVERLLRGQLKMPEAYERDQLPVRLRSYAARIQDDRAAEIRRARQRGVFSEERQAKANSFNRRWTGSEILKETRKIHHRYRNGDLTEEERDKLLAENLQRINVTA